MADLEARAAGAAGFGILALCLLGGYAESTREGISLDKATLTGEGGAASEAADLEGLAATVRGIVVCFFLTGALDIVVSLALLVFCLARKANADGSSSGGSPGSASTSAVTASATSTASIVAALAAFFRLAYACVVISCLNSLAQVPKLMLQLPADDPETQTNKFLLIRQLWDSFYLGFNGVALGLFGFHLALLAVPLASTAAGGGSTAFGGIVLPILLVLAGFGYTADAIGIFLNDHTYGLTKNGCFIGEVLLMGWLLAVWWSRGRASSATAASEGGGQPFLE